MKAETNFFIIFGKIEFFFCSQCQCSNPCIGPLPKIKTSFFLLSISGDELFFYQNDIQVFNIYNRKIPKKIEST